MFSSDTFCTIPWSMIQINTSGNFKVCGNCGDPAAPIGSIVREHGIGKDDNGVVMNIMTHSLEEALNSTIHKQIRLFQSINKRHPACRMCWDKEDAKVESTRQSMNRAHDGEEGYISLSQANELLKKDGSINNFPVFLDLRFGNLCNAKCIMCEPLYSSLWYEDYEQIYGKTQFDMGGAKVYNIYKENGVYKSDLPKWWESDNYFNQLQIIAPRIKRIYMAGGEPMIAPRHGDLLDMLISNGHAERIDLSYDTNLLAINDKILRRLQHFKSVQISVSADDIEDKFTYIRYPSSWKKVQSNMQLLEKYNLRVDRISVVIGIYSLYSMIRMVHYYRDIGFNRFRQRILNSPLMFDMKWLPRQAKIDAIKKYAESDIGEENYKLTIGYLYNNINVPENPIMLKACVDRMDKFDKIRGLNWKNTFPEVADILKDYIT